jgi:hypothetical protein
MARNKYQLNPEESYRQALAELPLHRDWRQPIGHYVLQDNGNRRWDGPSRWLVRHGPALIERSDGGSYRIWRKDPETGVVRYFIRGDHDGLWREQIGEPSIYAWYFIAIEGSDVQVCPIDFKYGGEGKWSSTFASDIIQSEFIRDHVRKNIFCYFKLRDIINNNEFEKEDVIGDFGGRSTGALIAEIRQQGSTYLDFYLGDADSYEIEEGDIVPTNEEVIAAVEELGWRRRRQDEMGSIMRLKST